MYNLGNMTVLDGEDIRNLKVQLPENPKSEARRNTADHDIHKTVQLMADAERSDERPKLWQ